VELKKFQKKLIQLSGFRKPVRLRGEKQIQYLSILKQTNSMDKFMLIFHSPFSQEQNFMDQSPEAMQAEMEKWNKWIGGIAAQGKLLGTEALMPTGKLMTKGGQLVTDGPYTEGKEIIGGYMLLNVASIEEATELAHGCPLFESEGSSVEVRPIVNFG
jgi:hypothetical protein